MTHHFYRLKRGQLFEKCPHVSNKWKKLHRRFILSDILQRNMSSLSQTYQKLTVKMKYPTF